MPEAAKIAVRVSLFLCQSNLYIESSNIILFHSLLFVQTFINEKSLLSSEKLRQNARFYCHVLERTKSFQEWKELEVIVEDGF